MTTKLVKVSELFRVVSGYYHVMKELDDGDVPLVSCGDTDNGIVGYYDIPKENQYERALTVAYNGSWPIMSKVHPYSFGAKDDVAVLVPLQPMSGRALLYIAALFNRLTWRYSYGRKCFREKLMEVELPVPTINVGGVLQVDEDAMQKVYPKAVDVIVSEIVKQTGASLRLDV